MKGNKKMRTVESIKKWLESLSGSELIGLWNEYQSNNGYEGEINYNDDEFFEIYFSKAIDAVRAVSYGDYRYTDEYVKFNGYGNLESFNYLDSEIDFDELAENILENESDYSYLDGLDDYDEEDEEDEEESEEVTE